MSQLVSHGFERQGEYGASVAPMGLIGDDFADDPSYQLSKENMYLRSRRYLGIATPLQWPGG